MAYSVLQYFATIPPNTPESAPITVPFDLDNWDIETIDLEVPSGASGLMGFYISNNGVQWIPAAGGGWLVWDDVQASWNFQDQPNASGWALVGYNIGNYPHSVTVRFHVNQPTVATPTLTAPQLTINTNPIAGSPVTL